MRLRNGRALLICDDCGFSFTDFKIMRVNYCPRCRKKRYDASFDFFRPVESKERNETSIHELER